MATILARCPILIPLFLFLVTGCEQNNFPDYSNDERVVSLALDEGKFKGKFILLNRSKRRPLRLESSLWVREDQFYISIHMAGGPANTRYQQYLHRGYRCPDSQDDLNRDGKLDYEETIRASGEIILPFDSMIQEQNKGSEWFPVSSKKGSYFYSRSASVDKMLKDLFQIDTNTWDGIGKLSEGESLDPERRVLILFGSKDNPLMPFACAVFSPDY